MSSMQVAGRLQTLCNKYGDFKVAKSWKDKEGETHWSKHRTVMECWNSEDGINWLNQVSHRQILPCEIVLDMDENPTKEDMNKICDLLEKYHEEYACYFTGSRGYHIHIKDKALPLMTKQKREIVRESLCKALRMDEMKKNEVMIALENVPHWKTGELKTIVRCSSRWEDF